MNKAVEYARQCLAKGNKTVGRYVKKQCREFLRIADGKDQTFFLDQDKITRIENILKLLVMPKGIKAGQSLYVCTIGHQWLTYTAAFCVARRDDHSCRKYEKIILEECRKNFKTFTVAVCFIILMMTEPKFSKFYSVAPDGSLSRLVKTAIEEILKSSPLIYLHKSTPRFNILRDSITFLMKENVYIPLNYSTSRFDGKEPSAYLADEVGALPNSYPIEAMSSGQTTVQNRLAFIVSTKYETVNNPFEDEVAYAKRVLDGIETDDTIFALLFEPDNSKNWATDDNILFQANPAALVVPEILEDLKKKRARAIAMPSARENFLTKHCNIIYQAPTEAYVDLNDLIKCRVDSIDWRGRVVYVGVDLAETNDNCAVVMASLDDDGILYVEPMAFIPEGRIEEKSKFEKVDYKRFIAEMKCIACGNRTVDYGVIEEFVFQLEETYGVIVDSIGYDRFNAMSSAQKWESGAYSPDGKYYHGIQTVEVRQHSDTLHQPTKLLFEKISNHELRYVSNELYEINYQNARCTRDTNKNRYVNKKKSSGKVDMVVATIDATYLIFQKVVLSRSNVFAEVF